MPQPLPHDENGQPIPWDKFGEAIQKGQAHFYENESVQVFDPASKQWKEAKGAEVGQYIRAGWQVPSPAAVAMRDREDAERVERQKVLGSPIEAGKALAEGYGRGMLPGAFDPIAGAIGGEDYTRAAAKRASIHALPAAAGELHGLGGQVLGASVLSGGAAAPEAAGAAASRIGMAARALTAPGRVLTGAGELAAGGATRLGGALGLEGVGLGARSTMGALRGGAAGLAEGGILGATGEISRATLENRPLTAQKLWASIEHGAVVGGVAGGVLGGLATPVSRAGRRALDAMTEGEGMNAALTRGAEKWQAKAVLGNNQRMWNEATYFGAQPERANRIARKLLDSGVPGEITKAIKHTESLADDAGKRMQELAKLRDGFADVGVEVDGARAALEAVKGQVKRVKEMPLGTYQDIGAKLEAEIAPLQARLDEGGTTTFQELWGIRKAMYRGINYARDTKQPHLLEMKELARNFDDALDGEMAKLGEPPGAPSPLSLWRQAKEDFHDYRTAADGYTAEATRIGKNRFYSPTDHALGIATSLATGSPIAGLAAGQANKLMRERGPAAMARLLDTVAKFDIRMNAATETLLGRAPDNVRKLAARPPLLFDKNVDKEFAKRHEEALLMAQRPEEATKRLGAALQGLDDHEDVATDLGQVFQLAHAYLVGKLPKPLTRERSSLTPLLEAKRIPRSEKVKWLEIAQAIDDPVGSIVRDAAKGRVSRVKLEAVKEVYPDLFQDWADRVEMAVAQAAQNGTPLPYRRRVFLSLTFGFNGDRSLEPDFLADIQATHAATMAAAEQAAASQGGGGGGPMPGQNMQVENHNLHTGGT